MKENSTYFFVLDNFTNEEALFLPLEIEKELRNVIASLPLISPSDKSVERLMTMIEKED